MNRFIKNSYALNLGAGSTSSDFKIFRDLDLNSTPQLIFNSDNPSGAIVGWHITNTVAPDFIYVKFYDTTSQPTVGTDTPVLILAIPGEGIDQNFSVNPIQFTNGCWVIATTGIANDDATDPATNQVVANIFYIGDRLESLLLEDNGAYLLEDGGTILLE